MTVKEIHKIAVGCVLVTWYITKALAFKLIGCVYRFKHNATVSTK